MKKTLTSLLLAAASVMYVAGQNNRSIDGKSNNLTHSEWGAAAGPIVRMTSNGYDDGISAPGGTSRTNPRVISNAIFDQTVSIPNPYQISDFGWAFGQFMDHDLSLVNDNFSEPMTIPVPAGDPHFDPQNTGTAEIHMFRSVSDTTTGTSPSNPRAHINEITAWIDASNVYGSDMKRSIWLRTFADGKLKTSAGNLLPFNTTTGKYDDPIDPGAPQMIIEGTKLDKFFVAGDPRANEQPILTSLHTLFVREHNRLCDELKQANPTWNDEELYQHARKMVNGYIQAIAFEEWLPALGIVLPAYTGYNNSMNPNIMNVFSAAAFRLGHTLINDQLIRLDAQGDTLPSGSVTLKDAFFNPMFLKDDGGIEPFFRGMATQAQQNFDTKVINSLRNFLFGPPGSGGLDLVSININRGRERGLADYNTIREDMGMAKATDFHDITSNSAVQIQLLSMYGSVDNIDPWVGMLAEDHVSGAAIGPTIKTILMEQFHHLRDGDRYYYENDPMLSATEKQEIKTTRLQQIIHRNTEINNLQDNVFFIQPFTSSVEPEAPVLASLNVYPNPASSQFQVEMEAQKSAQGNLSLVDLNGRKLVNQSVRLQAGMNQFLVNMEAEWASGVYYLVLQTEKGVSTRQVVKQ